MLTFFLLLGKITPRLNPVRVHRIYGKSYLKVIVRKVPQAIHILNQCHTMQWIGKTIDELHVAGAKQLK